MKKNNYPTRPRPFNYGYIEMHDWEYRKALRQCRRNKKRYGAAFDNSEAYQLPNAVCVFMLTHNYPINKAYLYFKAKGVYKEELFALHPDFPKDIAAENWIDEYTKVEERAKEDIVKQMAELDNAHKQELIQFILPRLQFISEIESIYVDDIEDDNQENWLNTIKVMLEELKDGNLNLFLENMWSLYCNDRNQMDEIDKYYLSL